jgi:hypothetical protein
MKVLGSCAFCFALVGVLWLYGSDAMADQSDTQPFMMLAQAGGGAGGSILPEASRMTALKSNPAS